MNKLIATLIGYALLFLLADFARAGSATWDLNPTSGDWNTATNWTPATVPKGRQTQRHLRFSNTTAISTSANTTVDGITFASGASSFTITASPGFILTISGVGITNNSGVAQNFVGAISNSNAVRLLFNGSATAGSGTFFTMNGGGVDFAGGFVVFSDNATAGNGSFTNNGTAIPGLAGFESFGGATIFTGSSTAGNGTFINNGATVSKAGGGGTDFTGTSTAANGTFINNGGTISGEFGGQTDSAAVHSRRCDHHQ